MFLQQQRSKIVHEKGEENSEIPDKNRAPAIYESKNALKSNFEEKISAELKSVIQEKAEEAIREFIKKSVKKYKELPPEKIISALSKEEKEEFPSSIFSEKISSLEAITNTGRSCPKVKRIVDFMHLYRTFPVVLHITQLRIRLRCTIVRCSVFLAKGQQSNQRLRSDMSHIMHTHVVSIAA